MAQSENPVGALAALFIFGLVALAIFNIGQGNDPDSTLLNWFTSHPDLFAGIIVFLLILGVLVNIGQNV